MSEKKINLKKIANYLDGKIIGEEDCEVENILPLDLANDEDISFFYNKKFIDKLKTTKAKVVVLEEEYTSFSNSISIVVKDAHVAYARLTQLFKKNIEKRGVSSDASIESNNIDPSSFIGPRVIIEEKAEIGKNVKILGGVYIGSKVKIEDNTLIYSNVSIYSETKIGKNCIIHANSVLGSDGLGFANKDEKWEKIEHLGIVKVENEVEIGSGCTIDRSSTGETLLKSGVKLDNQVHIAHNCEIGENTIIAGQVGIAGSSILGKNVKIGGQAGISGHLKIGDNVEIAGGSGVIKDIPENSKVMGYPAKNIRQFLKDNK